MCKLLFCITTSKLYFLNYCHIFEVKWVNCVLWVQNIWAHQSPNFHFFCHVQQNLHECYTIIYRYTNSAVRPSKQRSKRSNCIKFQGSSLKNYFRNGKKCQSFFFCQLCAYFKKFWYPSSNFSEIFTKEYSSQVSKRFEKYFLSYHADKLGHMDGWTERQMDGETDGCRQWQYPISLRVKE